MSMPALNKFVPIIQAKQASPKKESSDDRQHHQFNTTSTDDFGNKHVSPPVMSYEVQHVKKFRLGSIDFEGHGTDYGRLMNSESRTLRPPTQKLRN